MQPSPNQGSAKDGLSQPTVIWYLLLFLCDAHRPNCAFRQSFRYFTLTQLDLSLANIRVTTVGSVPFGLYVAPLDSQVPTLLPRYLTTARQQFFCELAFAGFVVGWIRLFLRQVIYHCGLRISCLATLDLAGFEIILHAPSQFQSLFNHDMDLYLVFLRIK